MNNTIELNERQKEAVEAIEGPVLVLAGAGSGKTRVLTERVIHLVEAGCAAPSEILAITFTNKAAQEMKDRIAASANFDTRGMWISTFHSLCVRILRQFGSHLGYTSNFTILDTSDTVDIMKAIYRDMNLVGSGRTKRFDPERGVLQTISRYRNGSMEESFGEYARSYLQIPPQTAQQIYELYAQRKHDQNAMDFDDLLLNACDLLAHHHVVRDYYQDRFRYLLIDEYQDTNPVQYDIVRILADRNHNIFAVGDDDQSIYGFRGATIRNILEFEEDFPNARIIRLEQNYRSTQRILAAANGIIAHNAQRKGKTLWSDIESDVLPAFYVADDERSEAAFVCADMERMHAEGIPYEQMAVLYRIHSISRPFEEALMEAGIPYRIYGGVSFYDRREIKDMVAYLNIIANPQADQSLLRIINLPRRGIGPRKIEEIQRLAAQNRVSCLEVLHNGNKYQLSAPLQKKAAEFAKLYDRISEGFESMRIAEVLERVYEETGYRQMLEEEKSTEAETRMQNIEELINSAAQYDAEGVGDFADYLQHITLLTDQDKERNTDDCVTLMTVHAAKGLEFDNVYVVGLVEGLFPFSRAVEEGHVEEERRLFYVAVTRARRRLVLTSPEARMVMGRYEYCCHSPFVDEIPEDGITVDWA